MSSHAQLEKDVAQLEASIQRLWVQENRHREIHHLRTIVFLHAHLAVWAITIQAVYLYLFEDEPSPQRAIDVYALSEEELRQLLQVHVSIGTARYNEKSWNTDLKLLLDDDIVQRFIASTLRLQPGPTTNWAQLRNELQTASTKWAKVLRGQRRKGKTGTTMTPLHESPLDMEYYFLQRVFLVKMWQYMQQQKHKSINTTIVAHLTEVELVTLIRDELCSQDIATRKFVQGDDIIRDLLHSLEPSPDDDCEDEQMREALALSLREHHDSRSSSSSSSAAAAQYPSSSSSSSAAAAQYPSSSSSSSAAAAQYPGSSSSSSYADDEGDHEYMAAVQVSLQDPLLHTVSSSSSHPASWASSSALADIQRTMQNLHYQLDAVESHNQHSHNRPSNANTSENPNVILLPPEYPSSNPAYAAAQRDALMEDIDSDDDYSQHTSGAQTQPLEDPGDDMDVQRAIALSMQDPPPPKATIPVAAAPMNPVGEYRKGWFARRLTSPVSYEDADEEFHNISSQFPSTGAARPRAPQVAISTNKRDIRSGKKRNSAALSHQRAPNVAISATKRDIGAASHPPSSNPPRVLDVRRYQSDTFVAFPKNIQLPAEADFRRSSATESKLSPAERLLRAIENNGAVYVGEEWTKLYDNVLQNIHGMEKWDIREVLLQTRFSLGGPRGEHIIWRPQDNQQHVVPMRGGGIHEDVTTEGVKKIIRLYGMEFAKKKKPWFFDFVNTFFNITWKEYLEVLKGTGFTQEGGNSEGLLTHWTNP